MQEFNKKNQKSARKFAYMKKKQYFCTRFSKKEVINPLSGLSPFRISLAG
jgi:hypothetical protein